jgi:hypothetical protein
MLFFCSESMDVLQLGRRRMGVRLGRNVPVLPVQASDGKGGHDQGNGNLEQEGYGEEGTGGETREDSRRKTEEQGSGARCADRGSRRGKAEPGWEVLVEGVVNGSILTDADTVNLCDTMQDTSHECTIDQKPHQGPHDANQTQHRCILAIMQKSKQAELLVFDSFGIYDDLYKVLSIHMSGQSNLYQTGCRCHNHRHPHQRHQRLRSTLQEDHPLITTLSPDKASV